MTKTSKQRSVRFDDALRDRLEQMAEAENRTFSAQVVWLVRQALAQRAFTHSQQQREVAADVVRAAERPGSIDPRQPHY
jgi:predicted transcriptional regulator